MLHFDALECALIVVLDGLNADLGAQVGKGKASTGVRHLFLLFITIWKNKTRLKTLVFVKLVNKVLK